MNAGFASLTVLKAHLLAEALRVDTSYDTVLTSLGLGVAATLEKFCNRKFQRTADDTFDCSADRDHVYLPRYPVEDVSLVQLKADQTTGFETLTDFVLNRDDLSGYVYWGYDAGPYWNRLRFTYTGGYWWDTTEEGNDTLPAGATALPGDLQLAWLIQCRAAWQSMDKLGIEIVQTGSKATVASTIAGLELNAQVKEMLRTHVRWQIT